MGSDIPTLEQFNWEKGGSFVATGTFTSHALYVSPPFPALPPEGNPIHTTSNATIALDIANSRYLIRLDLQNWQWGFPNGTYYSLNGVCSYVPVIYNDFLRVYRSAVQISTGVGFVNTYSGLIHEPGTCKMSTAITLVQSEGPIRTRLLSFSFGQVLNFGIYAGLPPSVLVPGHVVGSVNLNDWQFAPLVNGSNWSPPDSLFQLPSNCWNFAEVKDYCGIYYPVDFFNTPV